MSGFLPLFFGISLALFKTDVKFFTEQSFFQKWRAFFSYLCHICLLNASRILFLKRKVSIAFCKFRLRKLHIRITYKNFFRARHNFVLSLQRLELVQTKSKNSSHSDFPLLVYWTWVIRIKQITLTGKLTRKCWKSQNWWLKSRLNRLVKKLTKRMQSAASLLYS